MVQKIFALDDGGNHELKTSPEPVEQDEDDVVLC